MPNGPIRSATLLLTADDHADVYVNGQQVARIETWRKLHRLDVTPHIKPGQRNVIAIAVDNDPRSPGGLVGRLRVEFERTEAAVFDIDESWKVSTGEGPGWREKDFDDSKWPKATAVVDFGKDPWGKERAGFSASTEIDRRDWGLKWNQVIETGGVLVANKVRIEAEVQFVRA